MRSGFLAAQAIAERRLTAASLVEDSPAQITTAGGLYIPQNYDHHFKGWVSARTALGASLNVPAVRTLVMVTPDAFHRQLGALGLPLRENGDYFGYSLALGSAEVVIANPSGISCNARAADTLACGRLPSARNCSTSTRSVSGAAAAPTSAVRRCRSRPWAATPLPGSFHTRC